MFSLFGDWLTTALVFVLLRSILQAAKKANDDDEGCHCGFYCNPQMEKGRVWRRNCRLARVNGDFADGLLLRDERNGWRDGRPPAIAMDRVGCL